MRKNFSYKAVSSLSLLFLFGTLVYPHLPTRAETGAFSSESITGSTLAADEATTIAFEKDLRKPSLPRWIPGILGERLTRLAIDAVENALTAGEKIPASSLIPSFALNQLSPKEAVRWYRLGGFAKEETFLSLMENAPAEPALLYHLELAGKLGTGNRAQRILNRIRSALPKEYETYRALTQKPFLPPSAQEIRSLFYDYPNISKFQNGAFLEKPRLFLFCRHDRNYPCLLLMKDRKDQVVRTSSGKIWTQPGLGLSGYGKPFHERLGNTPSGVHLIQGVMPEANEPYSYGKFRRLILVFPPASPSETEMKLLLPGGVHESSWWRESAIARDIGRSELRIHGTGQRNNQPNLPFYPFIATIGCVAQREMRYGDSEYVDQRRLLDQLMNAQGLEASFSNETKIKALLYVMDIDEKKAPVTIADLSSLGIR